MYLFLRNYSNGIKIQFSLFFLLIGLSPAFSQNAIVTENLIAGVPASTWDIANNGDGSYGDKSIQGFGTDISVNKGGTINFKITVTTGTNKVYGIKIYRIGYYQGNGARLVADLGSAFTGISQNACSFDNITGLMDCGNWTTSASWVVPSTAVSGLYVAKLTRSAAGGGGSSHIVFVVRDDASTSSFLVKTSDATWQAYNPYGGYSLYVGPGMPFNHANKVSYNRPYLTRDGGGGGGSAEDWFMNAEYPMIRFLERNGYDISYTTDMDLARNSTNPILGHKIFLSVGHDEYWSKEERNVVEAAKTAGKHMAFFSGNEVYWKTRWENSSDGTSTPYRTMICYKEGTLPTAQENACGGKCDPNAEWTGLWRDGCSFPSGNACKPENGLTGQISWDGNTGTMVVPAAYKSLRFWRNTPVASLGTGQTATLTTGTLGYEWDWEQYQSNYPQGRITMSSTDFDGHTHKLSFYKTAAGGLIFGAGTVQWSWGLDAVHDRGNDPANINMQQATVNLFADMGAQPGTLQSGLSAATASTDVTPPVTTITSPANGATVISSPITITGTATDANVVAGVELSLDGGITWVAATGTNNWTYTWTPTVSGSYKIIARGIDDSGNYTATASSTSVTITLSINATANCPCTVFGSTAVSAPADRDNTTGIVVGMKFRSSVSIPVTGIRFYKASGNSGTHQGLLYNSSGQLLAQATFINETASGWQQVSFSTPVTIAANQTYVAAYFSGSGYYSATNNYFSTATVNGILSGLADGTDGNNGVYIYSTTPAYPNNTYQKGNYWVDLIAGNATPTANAGANQVITLPVSTVTLNGSGSIASTSYSWTLVSGPNVPTITTPSAVTTTVTGLIQGTYIFSLSINGGVSTSQTTITVNPAPPPTANAGTNQTITLPTSTVTLNGSASTGSISGYAWTLVSGPNIPVISTPSAVSTTVTGLVQGTYVFSLSLNGGVSTSQTTVAVNPVPPPTANAGANQAITLPASSVTLNGSASSGTISSYAWTLVSGPNVPVISSPSTVSTTVTGLVQGTYIFNLSLNGGVSTSNVTVTVNPIPPPTSNAGSNQTIVLPVSTVTLNGSASSGTITDYAWTRVSGPNTPTITSPAAVSTTVTGLIQGTYIFMLAVNSGISTSQVTITVNSAVTTTTIFTTQTPTVSTGNDGSALELGVKFRTTTAGFINGIRFYKTTGNTGTHTGELYNAAGTRLAQAVFISETATGWQQVNFTTPVAVTAGTTFVAAYHSSAGNYISSLNYFTAAVTNGPVSALADGTDGTNGVYRYTTTPAFPNSSYAKSNYWVDVIFSSTPPAPVANAGSNQTIALPSSTVTLNGSGSTGAISSYAWTLISGPNTPVITNATSVSTTVTGLIQGTYVFQLSINGGQSSSQTTITVNPAPPPTANAGSNQALLLPASSTTLNGSASTGSITSYFWSQISGPNTALIVSPTLVSTSVTGLVQGVYVFQLSLNGGVSSSQVTISLTQAPPPVANAGTNQTISLPASSATLSGSASTGIISSYLWSLISGPNTPVITTPAAVTTSVTGLVQGTYLFNLSLNGGSSSAQVSVTVSQFTTVTIFTTQVPTAPVQNDGSGIELGVKFRSSISGQINGVRFYKSTGNTGVHTGELYSSAGVRLAQAVFANESASGWQTVLFSTPVQITAGTTYIAAYHSSLGNYTSSDDYFVTSVVNNPLTALADGTDGPNALYFYSSTPVFPSNTYRKENYWVDAIFSGVIPLVDTIPPTISVATPVSGATGIPVNKGVYVFFNEPLTPSSINSNSVILQNGGVTVPATITYDAVENGILVTPNAALANSTNYTVTLKGGTGTNKIKDAAGVNFRNDSIWTFTTAALKVLPDPANGPGGPILLISSTTNPFSRYPVEILRAEGWNAFMALDITAVTVAELNKYDAVVIGDIALTTDQVSMLTDWVNAGGTLIALHPDPKLSGLLGINSAGGNLSNKYLLVNTATGPGVGIVNQTIQYHGAADLYTVNAGTNILATIYSDASTSTVYPAVTSRNVGTLGGQAIAFMYDLAKSIVYTRQGNPAWAGQKRDGNVPPIRSDDMFFGNASFDPQPDWVNLNKVAIPQADEQQRLLSNIIMSGSYDHKPLPRFWFLPKGKKAAIVMTGDDHGNGGTMGRMNQYITLSSSNSQTAVDNWDAIRSTSYMYSTTPITNAQIAALQNQGFEIGMHLNPNCSVWTPASLTSYFTSQLSDFNSEYYTAYSQSSHRIHCLSWSDWVSLPKEEILRGMRFDVNYYYWPDVWVNNKPGMFTGSGMPMRFADVDGSIIDCYQAPSQMTDESGQFYPSTIDALLNKATGPEGYYGVFTANMHTDNVPSDGSDAIINSATNLQIPVVSGKQMLDWIDARNNSTFSNFTWANNQLGFTVIRDPKALNLKGMLPTVISAGSLISLTQNGITLPTTTETIKGISYAFFDAGNGNYVANYGLVAPADKKSDIAALIPTAEDSVTTYTNYLGQNYPNPFYLNTTINYTIGTDGMVELKLFDTQGRPVKVLVYEVKKAGNYVYNLNTSNLSKGVYFYQIHSNNFISVKKLVIQ